MLFDLNRVIPYEQLLNDTEAILHLVMEEGELIVFKDNKPAFVISEFSNVSKGVSYEVIEKPDYTLQDAMKTVLIEQLDRTMHAAKLADEIFKRHLYWRKDGNMAKYNQIRARVGHYPQMFEALPKNVIRYIGEDESNEK